MNTNEENELYDDIKESMAEVEEMGETDQDSVGVRARTEDGKFAPKAEEITAAEKLQPGDKSTTAPEGEAKAPEKSGEVTLSEDRAPRGWSPASREKWNTLPADIRSEIIRREEASAQGVRQLQENMAPARDFFQVLDPYLREADQAGVHAASYISNVMGTERALRTSDLPGRFQAILQIADQYGVPLRDVINESVGQRIIPQPAPQPQMPPELFYEIQQMRQWREQQESAGYNSQIAEFASDKEFFADVTNVMASLIESGQAQTLQEAYDSACWANPTIREILMTRNGTSEGAQRRRNAAGASIKPGGSMAVSEAYDDEDDLHDTITKAFSRSTSGRV